jgi:lipopolysaccharide biosynthesis regulator YciM
VAEVVPERAYLAFERLESLLSQQGDAGRFERLCRSLIAANPQDWRAHLALGTHLGARGNTSEAIELLLDALPHNPHALSVHQAVWHLLLEMRLPREMVERYIEVTRQAIFYLDPHVCQRCHYRSTELLWQCPHCHEWDSFVEDRIAPAQDNDGASEPDTASTLR